VRRVVASAQWDWVSTSGTQIRSPEVLLMSEVSFRLSVAIAFGVVLVIVVATAVFNGSLSHTPYILSLWATLAVIALALYWTGRRLLTARRTK